MSEIEPTRGIPLLPWGLVGLVTVPLAVLSLLVYNQVSGFVLFGDAEWYASALPALTSDLPLYDPAKLGPHLRDFPWYWNQAPSTALVSLVQLLPGGRWLWGALMVGCVLAGLLLIMPRVGPGGTVLLAPVLIAWLPVSSVLAWANVNALVFLLLALALRFQRAAGLAIGIAAAVKLTPILGVAWLAGKRDWRAVAVAIGVLAGATLGVVIWKGPQVIPDFVRLTLNEVYPPEARMRWNPVEWLGLSNWVAYASAVVLALLAYRRASFSLAVIAMLVGVRSLHVHYLTWLLVPALCIWIPGLFRGTHQERSSFSSRRDHGSWMSGCWTSIWGPKKRPPNG